jgi:hypothetical protein
VRRLKLLCQAGWFRMHAEHGPEDGVGEVAFEDPL